jgi:hypothetical protein
MNDELNILRDAKGIRTREILEALHELYPSFDKAMLTKVNHSDRYGVHLSIEGRNVLIDRLAPDLAEKVRRRRNGCHRLTRRISCRLEDGEYEALQRHIKADGFDTMQGWLTDQVRQYLRRCKHI